HALLQALHGAGAESKIGRAGRRTHGLRRLCRARQRSRPAARRAARRAVAANCSPSGDAGLFEVRPTQPTGEGSVGRAFTPGDDSGILALASKVEAAEAGAIAHRAFYVKSPR